MLAACIFFSSGGKNHLELLLPFPQYSNELNKLPWCFLQHRETFQNIKVTLFTPAARSIPGDWHDTAVLHVFSYAGKELTGGNNYSLWSFLIFLEHDSITISCLHIYFLFHLKYHLVSDEMVFSHQVLISFIPRLQFLCNLVKLAAWQGFSDS